MTDTKKSATKTQEILLAGFRSGWAAAWLTIAEKYNQQGAPEAGAWAKNMADRCPTVEVADLSTPEGRAMKAQSETVYMERLDRRKP